jgi:hypothetical protein
MGNGTGIPFASCYVTCIVVARLIGRSDQGMGLMLGIVGIRLRRGVTFVARVALIGR